MPKKTPFSATEELILVQMYGARKQLIEGRLGPNCTHEGKTKAWTEILKEINSQNPNTHRTIQCLQKKISNIKQKGKKKVDDAKQTGGGRGPDPLTVTEEYVLDKVCSHDEVFGLNEFTNTGIHELDDTDETPLVIVETPDVFMLDMPTYEGQSGAFEIPGESQQSTSASASASSVTEKLKRRVTKNQLKDDLYIEYMTESIKVRKLQATLLECKIRQLNDE